MFLNMKFGHLLLHSVSVRSIMEFVFACRPIGDLNSICNFHVPFPCSSLWVLILCKYLAMQDKLQGTLEKLGVWKARSHWVNPQDDRLGPMQISNLETTTDSWTTRCYYNGFKVLCSGLNNDHRSVVLLGEQEYLRDMKVKNICWNECVS